MGATNFFTYGKGKDIKTAYRQAVDNAYYKSGHDSYNGTISTTQGAIDVTSMFPPRTTQKSKKMVMARVLPMMDLWDDDYAKRLLKELTPAMRPVVKKIAFCEKDKISKWGPCLGCRLDKTIWVFVGWAAM